MIFHEILVSFKTCVESSCEDGMIRLSPDGPSTREGRVEMCYQNSWGAVYDENWSQFDAAVICAQLKFSRTGQKLHQLLFILSTIIFSPVYNYYYYRCTANDWRFLWWSNRQSSICLFQSNLCR